MFPVFRSTDSHHFVTRSKTADVTNKWEVVSALLSAFAVIHGSMQVTLEVGEDII